MKASDIAPGFTHYCANRLGNGKLCLQELQTFHSDPQQTMFCKLHGEEINEPDIHAPSK